MNVRALSLVLATTALSALVGCATTQGPREGTTTTPATSQQDSQLQKEARGCSCAHKGKGHEGSAQATAEQGAGCGCPHCAHGASAAGSTASESKGPACGCAHGDKAHEGAPQTSASKS